MIQMEKQSQGDNIPLKVNADLRLQRKSEGYLTELSV